MCLENRVQARDERNRMASVSDTPPGFSGGRRIFCDAVPPSFLQPSQYQTPPGTFLEQPLPWQVDRMPPCFLGGCVTLLGYQTKLHRVNFVCVVEHVRMVSRVLTAVNSYAKKMPLGG